MIYDLDETWIDICSSDAVKMKTLDWIWIVITRDLMTRRITPTRPSKLIDCFELVVEQRSGYYIHAE